MINLHQLDGGFERVRRAEEHLDALRPLIDAMQAQHEQVVLAQLDNNLLHQAPGKVQAVMRIPILVGEICYNLRSALDYLVFELAKYDAGAPQKNTQFPIVDTPKKFRSERAARLKGVNDLHVGMIERQQPYNGCVWTKALRDISNPDKHRELITMKGRAAGWGYVPTDPEYGSRSLPVVRMRHPTHDCEMDVKVDLSYAVVFILDGEPVMDTLGVIKAKVFETLTDFRAEFK